MGGKVMKRFKSARGGVSLSSILSLVFIAFLIYEAFQFGPILMAQYQFKDDMVEAAKFSRRKDANQIKSELIQNAAALGLPVTMDRIRVSKLPNKTRIHVQYQLSVEWLPGNAYTWEVDEVAESPIY
jgi:hypothetical protein